ncbi:NAD(P)/FAD-dependent oxidoreductase [Reichenbachiella carrageenanivorans]|uniref:NAD(P)/FAD-dependent oxidoreductase n=1 Tax=Reichenbachiella carrageenanivorans TaxID=2979869 RepID=A0ABY6D2W2_9BACT|nr:NAD(P)/FAD-dependent oxidoreductase [Reichenbachiella carrageenanivorans]UXX80497.1 NAD(P)/FAD-dependent oxidoreductase [Reichenbachiella carrageenanivorans]
MYDVIVVGGGISGLINAVLLSRAGLAVALFEKNRYPFHRVCGEYISNEVKSFLVRHHLYPDILAPSQITKLMLTSVSGKQAHLPLPMGGFGISRFALDHFLFEQALAAGVEVFQGTKVSDISFEENLFQVAANRRSYQSRLVIGAYGKRSSLDRNRPFMQKKSPYLGVKYHIKTDLPADEIALHNFENGYCGVSQVENQTFNLCYLSHQSNLKASLSIDDMEQSVLHQNPWLKRLWTHSDFLFDKPEVISEISFEKKELVYRHVLMCGDTAGMITPLCGNGMAMAIRSACILSGLILGHWNRGIFDSASLELSYTRAWGGQFARRLWAGRQIQKLFGSTRASHLAVGLANIQPLGKSIVRLTHGRSF